MAEQQDERIVRREQRHVARQQGGQDADQMQLANERALGVIGRDSFWQEILSKVPSIAARERFREVAKTAILTTPKLLNADKRTLTLALMECARMGLMPGAALREFAMFVDGNGNVQYRYMYPGILKLVRNSGLVSDIDAQTVFMADPCKLIVGEFPQHEIPTDVDDRGEIRGCYAYALPIGATKWMVEYMTRGAIQRHAERYSDALKRDRDTPWKDPEAWGEMGNKTVLLRLMKMLPRSPEVMSVMDHEARMDEHSLRAAQAKVVSPDGEQRQQTASTSLTVPQGWGRQYSTDSGAAHEKADDGEAPQAVQGKPAEHEKQAEDGGSGRRTNQQIVSDAIAEAETVKDLEDALASKAAAKLQQNHQRIWAGLLRDAEAKKAEIERREAGGADAHPAAEGGDGGGYDPETGEVEPGPDEDDGPGTADEPPLRSGGRVTYTLFSVSGAAVADLADAERFLDALERAHGDALGFDQNRMISANEATIGMIVGDNPSMRGRCEALGWRDR